MKQTKDKAESFVWSDCQFKDVAHDREKRQLWITLNDYRSKRWRFLFSDIEELTLADPIFCVRSTHTTKAGKKRIVLYDDDNEPALEFCYSTVERHEPQAAVD